MIRKLNEKDSHKLMQYVMKEPEINIYIIGNVESFGYHQTFFELFGELDENDVLSAVLCRYFRSFYLYAKDNSDIYGFVDIIKSYDIFKMLVGKTNIVSKLEGTPLGLIKSQPQHFAVLKEINPSFETEKEIVVKKANIEDIERIANLRERIEEFSSSTDNFKEMLLNDFKAGVSHGYYVEINNKIVSYSQTSAENSKSAMLVNVMTDKEYRKRGLASACLKVLCDDLIKYGKTLCLFYKNPEAGAIYKRIGFKEIEMWSMYRKG
jgi:predicted GNAT family acetyltransferase